MLPELDGTNSVDAQSARICHVCLALIPNTRTYCTSCGHPLCKTCTCPVPETAEEAHKAFEASGGVHLTIRDGSTLTSYNRSVPSSPIKESGRHIAVSAAEASSQQPPRQIYDRAEDSRHQVPATTSLFKLQSSGKPCVKASPFIIADQITRSGPTSQTSQTLRRGVVASDYVSHRSDDDCPDDVCDNPACQTTQSEYRPCHHSTSRTEDRSSSGSADSRTDVHEQTGHYTSHALHHDAKPERLDRAQPRGTTHHRDHHGHSQGEDRQGYHAGERSHHGKHDDHGYSSSDFQAANAYEDQKSDMHKRYHPDSHSPIRERAVHRGSHHHHREEPSAFHRHHHAKKHDVQTQEHPREQVQPAPARLRGHEMQPEGTPDRLRAIHTKSSPALAQLWLSPQPEQQPVEDFREVRSKLRHNALPSKPAPEKKDKTVEDLGQARVKLCHYSPPPKATSTKGGTSVAEDGLRKIRSQAQLDPARATGRKEEARQTTIKDKAGAVSGPPPPSYGIFSVKGKSLERIEPSAMDKRKGKEVVRPQSEPQPASVSTRPQQLAVGSQVIGSQDHQSDWKERYNALKSEVEGTQGQAGDIGLEGLTIVLHMKGKDDLVINTDLRDLEAQ